MLILMKCLVLNISITHVKKRGLINSFQLLNVLYPIERILVRPNDSLWYCSNLCQMKRKMMRLFRKFKSVKSKASLESYREARNEYQRALDKAEDDYRKSLTDSLADSENTKGWWHSVKNLLCKGSFSSLPSMEVNNVVISDSKGKAEAFNDFFLSHASIDTIMLNYLRIIMLKLD